jgi:hypothetical protein
VLAQRDGAAFTTMSLKVGTTPSLAAAFSFARPSTAGHVDLGLQ